MSGETRRSELSCRTRDGSWARNRQVRGIRDPSCEPTPENTLFELHHRLARKCQRAHWECGGCGCSAGRPASRRTQCRTASTLQLRCGWRSCARPGPDPRFAPCRATLRSFVSVTRSRTVYQRPFSNFSILCRVVLRGVLAVDAGKAADAAPQPPIIRLHGSFLTGNVRPQKKSEPSTRLASSVTS